VKKTDIIRMESIYSKLQVLLEKYRELVNEGCINGCDKCLLGSIIIPSRSFPYEYAGGKLFGPLTICNLLGILSAEVKNG